MVAYGGESLADRDIAEYEWAMQYVDSNEKVVLLVENQAKMWSSV